MTWVLVTWSPVTSRVKGLSGKSHGAGRKAGPCLFRIQPGLDEVGKPGNSRITQEKWFLTTCKPPAQVADSNHGTWEEQWKNLRRP